MRIVKEISALSSSLLPFSSTVFMRPDTNNINSIVYDNWTKRYSI